jgi:hypothetical protein
VEPNPTSDPSTQTDDPVGETRPDDGFGYYTTDEGSDDGYEPAEDAGDTEEPSSPYSSDPNAQTDPASGDSFEPTEDAGAEEASTSHMDPSAPADPVVGDSYDDGYGYNTGENGADYSYDTGEDGAGYTNGSGEDGADYAYDFGTDAFEGDPADSGYGEPAYEEPFDGGGYSGESFDSDF